MITVIGSVNRDVVLDVPAIPQPGETVLAENIATADGGKGANQAVAAARLGASVRFVGAVGRDETGRQLIDGLVAEGLDVDAVAVVDRPSGTAYITVDPSGENSIVVVPGANRAVDAASVAGLVSGADVVLCQLEIPDEAVQDAARLTTGTFILNAAPFRRMSSGLVAAVDVLIVNEREREAMETAGLLGGHRPGVIVTTLGAEGAMVDMEGEVHIVPAPPVDAVDTTGAGDTFCGAFAQSVDAGHSLVSSARRAAVAGALATTRVGARRGMPTRAQLAEALER